jgi:hypothetical protein
LISEVNELSDPTIGHSALSPSHTNNEAHPISCLKEATRMSQFRLEIMLISLRT